MDVDIDLTDTETEPPPLVVPPAVWAALIPSKSVPVTEFLLRHTHRSPRNRVSSISISHSNPTHLIDLTGILFSETVASLLKNPLPSPSALGAVRSHLADHPVPPPRSIKVSFGTERAHFPIWIERCITQMVVVEDITHRWFDATHWLRSSASMHDVPLTIACEQRLSSMGWNTTISAGHSAILATSDLASFLGSEWLSDEHINAGGEWINRQLGSDSPIRVLNTHFLGSLASNRRSFRTWTPSRPRELDQLIQDLRIIIAIFPVYTRNHWTSLYVNLGDGSCVYVDTLHPDNPIVPDEVIGLVDWWLATVLPGLGGLSEEPRSFEVDQQHDSHSCGPATLTTMAHVALGAAPWMREDAAQFRKQWFLRLSDDPSSLTTCRGPNHDDSKKPLPEAPSHQFLVFDVDPDDLLDPAFNPIVSSKRSLRKAVAHDRTPIPDPSYPTRQTSSPHPHPPFKSPHLPVPSQAPLHQSTLSFPRISLEAWRVQEKLASQRTDEERDDVKERAVLEKERLRLAIQRKETLRKQDWRKRKVDDEVIAGVRGEDRKKKKPMLVCLNS